TFLICSSACCLANFTAASFPWSACFLAAASRCSASFSFFAVWSRSVAICSSWSLASCFAFFTAASVSSLWSFLYSSSRRWRRMASASENFFFCSASRPLSSSLILAWISWNLTRESSVPQRGHVSVAVCTLQLLGLSRSTHVRQAQA